MGFNSRSQQTRTLKGYNIINPKEHLVKGIPLKAHKITGFTPELLEHCYE